MGNKYVLNHDFGYGRNLETINKLKLRDVDDLRVYITNVVPAILVASYSKGLVHFLDDGKDVKLEIVKI